MKTIRIFFLFACLSALCPAAAQSTLIPRPVRQEFTGGGVFRFNAATVFEVANDCIDIFDSARERLSLAKATDSDANLNTILMQLTDAPELPAEGYRITVSESKVTVEGRDRRGLIWGVETLAQLLADGRDIPCQTIVDYPRFAHRGMHFDIGRTFSDKATVMRYIDQMARHKLNTFHWHLTDDEGWRIEIKSYPRLTEVGAWRGGDSPVRSIYGAWNERYGGFFTQDDIREVVAYAAARGVEIIPEIDLPGHSRAAAKAYPEILCAGRVDTTAAGHDIRNVWCATRDANFEMLDAVLGEVAVLFPSKYLHVGGDEVEPDQWEACPTCGPMMRKHGAGYVNGQFMARIDTILQRHGKRLAVWNEAMNGGNLPRTATVYAWENADVCRDALRRGYRTVLMPAQSFYLDMRQAAGEPGLTWAGTIELKKIYAYEPAALGFTAAEQKLIAGVEGALWTETLLEYGPKHVEYQLFPRLCALAEVAWSPRTARDYDDFNRRLTAHHMARLTAAGVGFRIEPPVVKVSGGAIMASHPLAGAEIRYADDGSDPDAGSELYTGPLHRVAGKIYRFRAFLGSGYSRVVGVPGDEPRLLTPAVTLTSSLKPTADRTFAHAADYKPATYARTASTCRSGDWFMWRFASPVDCRTITVKTGNRHLQRYVVPLGVLEVSYDGHNFEVVEPHFVRTATIRPSAPVRAVRLTTTAADNGENAVIIQDLEIIAK